jgi:hypothetical protein
MIPYLKDPKDSTKKLLDLINTFGNLPVYKINIQNSVTFLCINNEQAVKEIRKTKSQKNNKNT